MCIDKVKVPFVTFVPFVELVNSITIAIPFSCNVCSCSVWHILNYFVLFILCF